MKIVKPALLILVGVMFIGVSVYGGHRRLSTNIGRSAKKHAEATEQLASFYQQSQTNELIRIRDNADSEGQKITDLINYLIDQTEKTIALARESSKPPRD